MLEPNRFSNIPYAEVSSLVKSRNVEAREAREASSRLKKVENMGAVPFLNIIVGLCRVLKADLAENVAHPLLVLKSLKFSNIKHKKSMYLSTTSECIILCISSEVFGIGCP